VGVQGVNGFCLSTAPKRSKEVVNTTAASDALQAHALNKAGRLSSQTDHRMSMEGFYVLLSVDGLLSGKVHTHLGCTDVWPLAYRLAGATGTGYGKC
jgi:hypothetical protein